MSKWTKIVLAGNIVMILLVFIAVAHAQRPPELDSTGAAYLRVNINPTTVAPMVNINPNGSVPRVDLSKDVHVASSGCQKWQNFQSGIGRSIAGPIMVTYLHLPPQATATLNDGRASHSMNLSQAGQITTAIYLRAGQELSFDTDVMYSGCRPE
jgi:hypothetical protein